MNLPRQTDVLIIGAGPTGLSLAAQLLRYGVDFLLIDEKDGITDRSKAMIVHARSLEIFDQIGLAKPAVERGAIVQQINMLRAGEVVAKVHFGHVGGELSPFPFALALEQCKTEALLYSHLQANGKEVYWQTCLHQLTQHATGVRTQLSRANGAVQPVDARYVVGCDGASSATRHQLGLGFGGSTYPRQFFVADVDMNFPTEPGNFYATIGKRGLLVLFPMEGHNRWRLIGNVPEDDQAARAGEAPVTITAEVVAERVKSMIRPSLQLSQVHWLSSYKVHTRHAERFSEGRCFLAGDAAHIHTPAGGQGMNTGIQDAYNLAWKLAFVLNGTAPATLLETYNEERLANAKRLLESTDRIFEMAANDNWLVQFVRDTLLPGVASVATQFEWTRKTIFPIISMIGLTYRDSSLSRQLTAQPLRVRAGDRMPYFLIDGRSIYAQLTAPTFHLLLFTDGNSPTEPLPPTIRQAYGDRINVLTVPLYPQVVDAFGLKKPFMVLLRPDNYIGLLSETVTAAEVRTYLQAVGLAVSEAPAR